MKHHLTETHEHNFEIHNIVLYILTMYQNVESKFKMKLGETKLGF